MTKQFDPADMTRRALSGGAEDWFDAFWYREPSTSGPGRISQTARLLRDKIAGTRIHHSVWRVHAREIVAITLAAMVLLISANQRNAVTNHD